MISALWPSVIKSSSSGTLCEISSISGVKSRLRSNLARIRSRKRMLRKSLSTMLWMPGYCTLTATSRPPRRVGMVARPALVRVFEAEPLLGHGDRLVAEVDAGGERGGGEEAVAQAHGCTSMEGAGREEQGNRQSAIGNRQSRCLIDASLRLDCFSRKRRVCGCGGVGEVQNFSIVLVLNEF